MPVFSVSLLGLELDRQLALSHIPSWYATEVKVSQNFGARAFAFAEDPEPSASTQ